MEDGSPYRSKHTFTCMAQADGLKRLFEEMAAHPQDYVSERGRLTTNTVEGFHGLALLYRDKKTDLGHVHYTCKTNICQSVTRYLFMLEQTIVSETYREVKDRQDEM